MDTDALIEQIAFGKTTPKMSTCMGLFLSPDAVYLTQVRLEKGKPAVDHLVRIPIPAAAPAAPKPAGTVAATSSTFATDFLSDPAKVVALVRQAMSQTRWSTTDVVVSLSHHLSLLRYFTMPGLERRFWTSAVPLEAKKYIPIPFDTLSWDFQIAALPPAADGRPRQGALVGVTSSKNTPNIVSLVQALGLNLVGIEVAPCSVLRLWNALNPARARTSFAQIHFDEGNVRVMVSDKGLPVFFREVFLGPEASPSDTRKIDLAGCVGFAKKQLGITAMSEVSVGGTSAHLGAWRETFSQELGGPISTQDSSAQLGLKGGDWGAFAAIGTGLRYIAPTPLTIDLSPTAKISEAEKLAAKAIFGVAALISAGLLGVGFFLQSVCQMRVRALRSLQGPADVEAVFLGKSPTEIESLLASMRDQAAALKPIENIRQEKMSLVLRDVVDSLPEKGWVTSITINNPVRAQGSGGREMTLTGHVVGANLSEEEDLAFQFKERLLKTPVLGKMFPEIQMTVSRNPPKEDGTGTDPEALRKSREERTTFTVLAKFKK